MNKPSLSVIMPVYNAADFIEAAVKSILAQTYDSIEVVCVNDCSEDNSIQILHKLAQEDERVIVIDSPINVGAGEARNLGIDRAVGKYITFVDADDTIEPDLYERAMRKIIDTNADEVVWGLIEEHYDNNDNLIKTISITDNEAYLNTKHQIIDRIIDLEGKTLFGYQWNSIYRASIIKDNGIRFEKSLFYEDYFFNLDIARHLQSLAVLDYAGYHYFRRMNHSITHRFTVDYFPLSYRRIASMYSFCSEAGYTEQKLYNVLGNRLLRYTFSALSRNHDPRSGMHRSNMIAWCKEISSLELYSQLLSKCQVAGSAHKVLSILIKNKHARLMVIIGKIVYMLGR